MKTIIKYFVVFCFLFGLSGCLNMQVKQSLSPKTRIGVISVYGTGKNADINPLIEATMKEAVEEKGYSGVLLRAEKEQAKFDVIKLAFSTDFFKVTDESRNYLRPLIDKTSVDYVLLVTDDPYSTEIGAKSPYFEPRTYRAYITGIASGKILHLFGRFKVYFIQMPSYKITAHQFGAFTASIAYQNWLGCQNDTPEAKQALKAFLKRTDVVFAQEVNARVQSMLPLLY